MDMRLIWLALGTFAIGAEGFAISSLLPGIAAETGVSMAQSGYLVFAYAIAYAIGAPVLASLTGASDRRSVLAAGALVFGLGAFAAGFATHYAWLLVARVAMAACAGLYAATAQATAVTLSTPVRRARAISVIVGGTTLAVAFGAPIGGVIATLAGWRGTYFAIAGAALVAAIAIWFLLPKGLRGEKKTVRERLAVVAIPGVMPALLTTLLYITGGFIVFVYIAPLSVDAMGLDRGLVPAVMLAYGIGAALGNYAGGQIADRVGAQRTVTLVLATGIAMMVLLSAIALLPDPVAGPVFFTFMVVWGFVGWIFPPAQASYLVAIAPQAVPLVLALNASALYLGVAMGALAGGYILEHAGAAELGWMGAAAPLLGLVLILARRRAMRPIGARLG